MNLEPILYTARCPECRTERLVPMFEPFARGMDPDPDIPGVLKMRCDTCLEKNEHTRKESGKAVEKASDAETRRTRWESICPFTYRTESEGGPTDEGVLASGCFEDTKTGPVSYQQLKDFGGSERIERPLVFLCGNPGTRKTRIAFRMARAAFDAPAVTSRPWGAVYTSWGFQTAAQDAGGKFEGGNWIRKLIDGRIVVLDDLGKTAWTDNTAAAFFELVEIRAASHHVTVITSNNAGQDLKDWLKESRSGVLSSAAEPILRRLRELGRIIVCR